MGGKPVPRVLPALAAIAPGFAGFAPTQIKAQRLALILRQAARRVRRTRAHTFYAMRDVAAFFGVSLATVSEAYRQLEREGLLSRQRGAKTVVRSTNLRTRTPVRALVGVPIWLPGFLRFADWRQFHMCLEEELRRQDCAAVFIFYQQGEQTHPEFAERVLRHKPDFLVWLTPASVDRAILQMVGDAGVQVVPLWPADMLSPDQKYAHSQERATRAGLAEWARAGRQVVVFPRHNASRQKPPHPILRQALRELGLKWTLASPGGNSLARYLGQIGRGPDLGVLWDDGIWFVDLCARMPQGMARLLQETRSMVDHPIPITPADLGDARVDVIDLDLSRAARRIARDLASEKIYARVRPLVFEARWRPQVLAAEFAAPL